MKKLQILALIVTMGIFAGCNWFSADPSLSPEETIKQGLSGFYNVYSASYELEVGAEVESDLVGETVSFEAVLGGIFNLQSKENPHLSVKLTGNGVADDGDIQEVDLEMRVDKNNFYGIIASVPDLGEEVPTELLESFVGQWWKIALPPTVFDNVNFAPEDREANLTPEEKQMKELMDKTNFFKDIKYLGNAKVKGEKTFHYSAVLDTVAVQDFVAAASEIDGTRISGEDLVQFGTVLTNSNFEAELWIGQEDNTLRKLAGKFTLNDETGATAQIDFALSLWDLNKDLAIEIPEEAKEFDPMMFLGAAALMQGGDSIGGAVEGDLSVEGALDTSELPEGFDPNSFTELPAVDEAGTVVPF